MTIEDVAKQYKLRTQKLGDEVVIPAKLGHIFMWSDEDGGVLGALYSSGDTAKGWNKRRKEWLDAGAKISQNGDTEGIVTFPASHKALLKLTIKLLKASRRRVASPETVAKRLTALATGRAKRKKVLKNRGSSR